jgi:hypothetical protein
VAVLTPGPSRVWAGTLLAAFLAIGGTPRAAQRTAAAEDDIKAAFLFNFTKFIEWPETAQLESFRICTVAEPAFNAALDRTLTGETANGRPIVRVSPATPDAARACQILFLGRVEDDRVERWLTAVRGAPVLVVGESRATWERGGQINFVVDENRVKFDVNSDAAAASGLTISSKLLRVARKVTARRSA